MKNLFRFSRRRRRDSPASESQREGSVDHKALSLSSDSSDAIQRARARQDGQSLPVPDLDSTPQTPRSTKSKRSFLRYFPSYQSLSSASKRSSTHSNSTTPSTSPNHRDTFHETSRTPGLIDETLLAVRPRVDSMPLARQTTEASYDAMHFRSSSQSSLSQSISTAVSSASPASTITTKSTAPPKLQLQMPPVMPVQKILPRIPLSAVEQSPTNQLPSPIQPSPSDSSTDARLRGAFGSSTHTTTSQRRRAHRSRRPGSVSSQAPPSLRPRLKRPGTAPTPSTSSTLRKRPDDWDDPPSPAPIGDDAEIPSAIPKLSPRPVSSGKKPAETTPRSMRSGRSPVPLETALACPA
ncbi:hypothetical protein FRB99_005446 [Tulasnella sp. 403]|nr:hypothetical protein FRB99_005446 [Tulasnella sp. 403]